MFEAIEIINKLFSASLSGKEVRHSGDFYKMESTRLWTMPAIAPQILVATSGPVAAKRAGRLAGGLITVEAPRERLELLFNRFTQGAREAGKDPSAMPKVLQMHLSWAETDEQAMANALREWPNGGMPFSKADIRSPYEFEQMAKLVRPEDFEGRMVIDADPDVHRAYIQKFVDLGFDRIYLHNVGRNQREWVDVFSRDVLPALRR
jgi:coenzyme F420-dependent glucose-6-phosphate dehydrogenase